MKKLVILLLVATCSFQYVSAQRGNGYFGITLGPSIPIEDFASKDPNNEAAGWANVGGLIDLSFAYEFGTGNFGVTAILRGQSNPTDAQALADAFAAKYNYVNWIVSAENWSLGGLLVGGYGSFDITEKSSFETRGMIGFLNATSPEIKVTGNVLGMEAWTKRSKASATAFSYLLGAGFKFGVGSKLYFLTNLDYLGSKPEFLNVETTTSFGSSEKNTYHQNIGTLNLSVGLGFKI